MCLCVGRVVGWWGEKGGGSDLLLECTHTHIYIHMPFHLRLHIIKHAPFTRWLSKAAGSAAPSGRARCQQCVSTCRLRARTRALSAAGRWRSCLFCGGVVLVGWWERERQ